METISLKEKYDHLAPDGSEIRLLVNSETGGLCHCTLLPGKVSQAVKHRHVTELWFFIEGAGEVWRKKESQEMITAVCSGTSLTIEPGICFQFRNLGKIPLKFIIATIPQWPGPEEAESVHGNWP
jgi:mannose-6-phosphate isomerase-like protein (cupin superfamily)